MIKIGEFSKMVQVSVPTLRYYDQMGLLKPIRVDEFTGYRYYSASQLPRLHRILALKGLGFPLEQIAAVLDEDPTPEEMRGMLRLREVQLRQELADMENKLVEVEVRLQQIEREHEISPYDVILKNIEPLLVASVRGILPTQSAVGALFAEVIAGLGSYVTQALGPNPGEPGTTLVLWYNTEHKETDVDGAAAFMLRCRVPESGHMRVHELPASTMASTIHHGAYNRIGEAHEAVLQWIEANGYQIVGPDREINIYNTMPARRDDPSYVTEIQYPVEKIQEQRKGGIMTRDEIVPIPENRMDYFGGPGRMLLPSPETIAAIIDRVPAHQLLTTDQIRAFLTEQFEVEGVCPVTTQKSLHALAHDPNRKSPYWRVTKKNGELMASYPGGVEAQADHLREAGFAIDTSGKKPKVKKINEHLVRFD